MALDLRLRDLQVLADLACEKLLDLTMARHRGHLARLRLNINGMAATLSKKTTAMRFQMSNEIDSLHARSSTQTFADYRLALQIFLR